jgi:hypothetical protein
MKDPALKPTTVENGLYVLGDVYQKVDGSYFAESPLNTGILRKSTNCPSCHRLSRYCSCGPEAVPTCPACRKPLSEGQHAPVVDCGAHYVAPDDADGT